jgi:hypothetical protein
MDVKVKGVWGHIWEKAKLSKRFGFEFGSLGCISTINHDGMSRNPI